ncbi:hypothetical protein Tco_0926799 [Tanacetum coccineum]|uniref:Uncharacterized protein n=1 Tax=Tanacetum coccineum TaxID=301880 RepID=A0ABQ5DAT4_9ASTR
MVAETNFTTLTAKLPILNPGDYDLWLMRIDQYFLLTDYSLWEVIKNGNKVLKRTVGETEHEYEPKISGSSSTSQNPQNVAFVSSNSTNSNSSTNEVDNTAYGVSAVHTQSNPTSGDNLSDVVICAFLASQLKVESAGVKSNGDAVEPKTVRKNNFRPPVIEDWNFDDESEVEIIPKDKTVFSSTEKKKFVKSARETVEKVETSKQNKHYPRWEPKTGTILMFPKTRKAHPQQNEENKEEKELLTSVPSPQYWKPMLYY